jgi:thymidine kinase
MLKVIVGGMFAGKSTEVQRQGKRYEIAKKNVLYIKPQIDNRYSENQIVTHDGQTVSAISVPIDKTYDLVWELDNYDVFVFDEVQFFERSIIKTVKYLLAQGKIVVCGGLDMDFAGEPFPITSYFMAVAEEVIKLHAVCEDCGDEGLFSQRTSEQKDLVVVGNDYKPLCRACYNKSK